MESSKDKSVKIKSKRLRGKRIGFGISGGIGAVESVKIIRELRRHEATVKAFMTADARRFVTEMSIAWACESTTIVDVAAEVEHLDPFDLVILAPATLNTITKSSLGLCDNPVTLLVASQLGRQGRLLIVPTMNGQLMDHPAYPLAVERLKSWGALFFENSLEEGRLKMPAPEQLLESVFKVLHD